MHLVRSLTFNLGFYFSLALKLHLGKLGKYLNANLNKRAVVMSEYTHKIDSKRMGAEGLTLLELMVTLAIIGILAAISFSLIVRAKNSAYEITAQHDLKNFAKAEEMYLTDSNRFIGDIGQTVRNDGAASDFVLPGFTPSQGVSITIVSGDAENPFDQSNPYVARSIHRDNPGVRFEYNFLVRAITKSKNF